VALLANLGLICGAAAAIAANAARRSERARARALIDSFTAVRTSAAGTESGGFVSPACGAFTSLVPAQLAGAEDLEDLGVGLAAFAMAANG
jgi:hypothetical protein